MGGMLLEREHAQDYMPWQATIVRGFAVLLIAMVLAGCARIEMPAHLKPLSRDATMLLGAKEMRSDAPIFMRIFKAESELEVWKQRDDGRYYHFKTYPICTWSGTLGPKLKQGDKQAPEGFYRVNRHQMNPASDFHLAFNLGYPNAYDRAHGRSGDFLMVHGECSSAGCYAMTNGLIEEIYALAREAFIGGQNAFDVHAFPFRMTDKNMARYTDHEYADFWATLKTAYDLFETNRVPPPIAVCERRYVVNAVAADGVSVKPTGRCPKFKAPDITPFSVTTGALEKRVLARGPKKRRALLAKFADRASGLSRVPAFSRRPPPSLSSQPLDAEAFFNTLGR